MKITKITKVLAMLSFIGFAGSSFAQVVTVNDLYINSINVGVKANDIPGITPNTDESYVTIRPSSVQTCTGPACIAAFPVCGNKHVVLMPGHNNYDEIYSMLLSAQFAEKKISVTMTEISERANLLHCRLESIESIN